MRVLLGVLLLNVWAFFNAQVKIYGTAQQILDTELICDLKLCHEPKITKRIRTAMHKFLIIRLRVDYVPIRELNVKTELISARESYFRNA